MIQTQDLRAVTFDVGGTLIVPWPSVGHVYVEVAARNGYASLSPDLLNRRFAASWKAFQNFRHTRSEWATLVDTTFHGLIDTPPSRSFFPALYDRFGEPGAWHVFEDVVPTLDGLKSRGLKLGVISNWDDRLRPLLRALKLHDYFETIVVSCEVGCAKPSRLIFDQAVRELAVPAGAILHIGDSYQLDVQGAESAGFRALMVQRGARPLRSDAIHSLQELQAERA